MMSILIVFGIFGVSKCIDHYSTVLRGKKDADAANRRIITKRITQLKENGKIGIIISHDYEFLLTSCNTILAMNKSSFTAFDPKNDKEKIRKRMRGKIAAR